MLLLFFALCFTRFSSVLTTEAVLSAAPKDVLLEVNETTDITFQSRPLLPYDVELYFNHSDYFNSANHITLSKSTGRGQLQISARKPISLTYLDVVNCSVLPLTNTSKCELKTAEAFVRVTVIESHVIYTCTIIVGWMYFFAWSLSFYPQMFLNFRRKSVTGLNFDFLLLNLIGFSAYSLYNLLMYYDVNVQAEYKREHPRSPIPVLLNDVVFAVHASGLRCDGHPVLHIRARQSTIVQSWHSSLVPSSSFRMPFWACRTAELHQHPAVRHVLLVYKDGRHSFEVSTSGLFQFSKEKHRRMVDWQCAARLHRRNTGHSADGSSVLQCCRLGNLLREPR